MLFLSLKTNVNEINRLNTDHVQPKNPLFTSDSQHPPRSRHAVHLGDFGFLSATPYGRISVSSSCWI